jgi:hypothetical protein
MLQTSTVERETLELLKRLMDDERLSDFFLAGGTNLALQLGHRKSIDLDLFPNKSFNAQQLEQYLTEKYNFTPIRVMEKDTVTGFIQGVKVDFIAHIYPFIQPPFVDEAIRMYSIQDVACMKLVAISDNGTRLKDFVDIAYLSTKMSLIDMLFSYKRKYNRPNYFHALRGLSYFDEIDFNVPIHLCNEAKFEWKKIEHRIREMIKNENKIFEKEPI